MQPDWERNMGRQTWRYKNDIRKHNKWEKETEKGSRNMILTLILNLMLLILTRTVSFNFGKTENFSTNWS